MSVNQSIFGTPDKWSPDHFTYTGTDRSKMFLIPYFGESRNIQNINFSQGCLKVGLIEGKLERADEMSNGYLVDEPLDNSLSYCALGNNSVYSRIAYFKPSAQMFENGFEHVDNRLLTNFVLTERYGNRNGFYLQDTGTGHDGGYSRFAPSGFMTADTVGTGGNKNQSLVPFAQIPIKNCVLVPIVRYCSGFDETNGTLTDLQGGYLWDYLDTTAQKNYRTHPYIVSIGFEIHYSTNVDTIDSETGKPATNRTSATGNNDTTSRRFGNVAILSGLDVAKGIDINATNPDLGKLDKIYSYWFTYTANASPSSAANVGMIFGAHTCGYANGSSVGVLTTTNTSNPQYGIVFTHPHMVWRKATNNNNRGFCYIQYYDGLTEWIRSQIACFGLFFTDDEQTALNGALNDEKMFLGILEEGVGNGLYSHGEDNEKQPQWTWETSNDSTYDPKNPPKIDPNQYDDTSGFNNLLNAPRGFNARYVLTPLDIKDLNTDFFQALNSKPDDIDYINYSMSEFLTNDPLNAIVSLKWFPFTVPSYGSETAIKLGNYNTTVTAKQYVGSGVEVYNIGEFDLFPFFGGSFLDYEPYSKTSLVIPYCGTVQLDHSIYMDTHISVHLNVDIYTGACTAYIKSNGLVVDSVSGVCSVDMPITGIDNATLEGQIYNASLNLKSSKISEGTTIAGAGLDVGTSALGLSKKGVSRKIMSGLATAEALVGAVESVNQSTKNLAQNEYNVSHVQIPMKTVGAQSGLNNAKQEQFCRVLLQRPIFINGAQSLNTWYGSGDSSVYAHTVGYACLKMGKLSDFTGFTVCSNADLSGITATDAEKEQILRLLQSGVYV